MSDKPKVLLLGDSIRMNYQSFVARNLEGKADVVGPKDNGQFSLYTLFSLNRWIDELGKPDIVHWNNGLHDCGYRQERFPAQFPIEMYRANLGFILKQLREMTPNVIWATTTPIHPDRPFTFGDEQWGWSNEDIDLYNRVARELMEVNDVPINNLHELVWKNRDSFLMPAPDWLHLNEKGQKACGDTVAKMISEYLP